MPAMQQRFLWQALNHYRDHLECARLRGASCSLVRGLLCWRPPPGSPSHPTPEQCKALGLAHPSWMGSLLPTAGMGSGCRGLIQWAEAGVPSVLSQVQVVLSHGTG